jgi:hypothetical protein
LVKSGGVNLESVSLREAITMTLAPLAIALQKLVFAEFADVITMVI